MKFSYGDYVNSQYYDFDSMKTYYENTKKKSYF